MKSIETLYRKYRMDVYYYLLSRTRDPALAEDLLSETFLAAIRSLPSYRGDSDIKTWLIGIARNRYLRYLKKNKRLVVDDELAKRESPTAGDLSDAIISRELLEKNNRVMLSEPPRSREILRRRIHGQSHAEIARACDISESSCRVILHRLRQRLRQDLEKEGYQL